MNITKKMRDRYTRVSKRVESYRQSRGGIRL